MNRPKKQRKSKHVQLWTHPLARGADTENRLIRERELAQIRPFVITQVTWLPAAVAVAFPITLISTPSQGGLGVSIPELSWSDLRVIVQTAFWIVAGIGIYEFATRWKLGKGTMRSPANTHLQGNLPANAIIIILVLLAAVALAWLVHATVVVLVLMAFMGVYLITTGIHRRVGWNRRCAKCAYPHPDPKPYPVTCPECGRTLRPDSYKDIILGKNVRSVPRIVIGLFLLGGMGALIALN